MITLFVGRFQPFHLGHIQDVKKAGEFSSRVIIGIGSSQEENTKENPFSFEERREMIRRLFPDIEIIGIPDINDDEHWVEHVKSFVKEFDLVYTGNSRVKRLFEEKKVKVEGVSFLPNVSATEIRRRIHADEDWEELMPDEVVSYLKEIKGIERIKEINGG